VTEDESEVVVIATESQPLLVLSKSMQSESADRLGIKGYRSACSVRLRFTELRSSVDEDEGLAH
jgi:hypothetical protein